jgi:diaminohydroxyphosphoribosylaminopyrimidine deaminase/5-amino-6-(5-phosphoribosylamino)uracil reductase
MTQKSTAETYMQRCLDLAITGLGKTAPNPMVGAVIVHNDQIIGEGYHKAFGGPHAEVNAVNAVRDKTLLKDSTLYVNLEPCSHTGKTPPCADLIIRSGIPHVVGGMTDPNPVVAGSGYTKLRHAGVEVVTDILHQECVEMNRRFIMFHTRRRPYVILKWAQTSDCFIDVVRGQKEYPQPTWISNEISRMLVHKWRSEEQSILVGTNTAMMDNPRLNVREWPGRSPLRMVIDKTLKLPETLNLFDNSYPTVVFNSLRDEQAGNTRYAKVTFDDNFLENMLRWLYESGIQSVLVEGGKILINSLIRKSLWDEARVFKGNKLFGQGVTAPSIPLSSPEEYLIREDLLMIYRNG